MYISRLVVRNFRNFEHIDVELQDGVTCVIGQNNSGKTNLFRAIRLAVDANLSSQFRQLLEQEGSTPSSRTVELSLLLPS